MKRFKFPFAYKSKVNLKNTILYSNILKELIFKYLTDKYKCVYIDPTFIVDNKQSTISYLFGDRVISFDNKSNNSILAMNSTQDNYLLLMSKLFKNTNMFTFAPIFKRDSKLTNLDSIISWTIGVELSIPINLNMQYFTLLAKETYYALANLTRNDKLNKIFKVNEKKLNPSDFSIIDAQKLENLYPSLPLKDAFKHYCSQQKFVIVQNNIKKLKSGLALEPFIPTAQDMNLSCGLYVYDKVNCEPIQILNICKRPEGKVSRQQLNETNPIDITNNLYDDNIFKEGKPTNISLVINFSNLIFYFLDKVHLAEVVKSAWTDEFIKFVKIEGIEVF